MAGSTERILYGKEDKASGRFVVSVIDLDGGANHPLVEGRYDVSRPSHDGTRVALTSVGSSGQLFPTIVGADGSGPSELHPDPTLSLGAMVWSRDDRWLAFEGWDESDSSRDGIWLMRPDGSGLKQLTVGGNPGDFSPDDSELVFTRDEELWIVGVDGSGERQIGDVAVGIYPGFMPDGGTVYAAVDGDVGLIDLETGRVERVQVPGEPYELRLSPDGRRFVFSLSPQDVHGVGIWWMNIDGTNLTEVVDRPGVEEVFPDWLR